MIIFSFLILGALTLVVYIEEQLEKTKPELGEEWDFLRPTYIKK